MTSLALQTQDQMGGRLSVLTRQKKDHVRLDRLLNDLAVAPSGPAEDRVLREIARLVFPHAFAEESVLWPVMRRVLPDGEELTLQVEQEHQEVNELWTSLEELDADDPRREPLLDRLTRVLQEDVRDEEDELFPRLQERISERQLQALGLAWEIVRRISPTRPHPVVARRPPGNALAALPLTLTDRARDNLDRVAQRSERLRDPAERASAALARIAGRIEDLPIMRIGERASTSRAPGATAMAATNGGRA
ncbi:hemerythrin domain-containing protein [Aeromicrobium duanguangcaii]|uniref:Hemerythrin domain-containing protein n=1 Tax=Aeromicrobium duanguangcaii TaxID=2968086 RepID=A0ABY5KBF4_9ACTN|nr:hemerythrin domain-containing protein [Aeromicrobium duanguangcaii]MCD9154799.1 hemerythrin domain-containing protein [Aeromicrobium duanguangcaii]UUI67786.1 hemerythrin domain-containing protein [Aeromicrobium duanguangcaii]